MSGKVQITSIALVYRFGKTYQYTPKHKTRWSKHFNKKEQAVKAAVSEGYGLVLDGDTKIILAKVVKS